MDSIAEHQNANESNLPIKDPLGTLSLLATLPEPPCPPALAAIATAPWNLVACSSLLQEEASSVQFSVLRIPHAVEGKSAPGGAPCPSPAKLAHGVILRIRYEL